MLKYILVRRYFPKGHKLINIFNENTLKVSYSCMRNMSPVLSSHNKKISEKNEKYDECNCRNKDQRILEYKCLPHELLMRQISSL